MSKKPDNHNLVRDMEKHIKESGILSDVNEVTMKIKKLKSLLPKQEICKCGMFKAYHYWGCLSKLKKEKKK